MAATALAVTAMTLALAIGILASGPVHESGWACAAPHCGGQDATSRLPAADEVMQDWVAARSL